ncbi:MAG: DUF5678 domain-containing protein [Candidatus Tectomicrobia bacterium]|nr:DUF5678 domain-containing protein [Candidatus Tectomicrobia bacterium]
MDAFILQQYDEWLADHMEEIVEQYPSQVVAIHEGHIIYTGESEEDVYRWIRKKALTPMPLVFRVPRPEDLNVIL